MAAGAYLGLRERSAAPVAPVATASAAPSGSSDRDRASASPTSAPGPSAPTPLSNAETDAEVKKALADLHGQIMKSCWTIHEHDKEMPKHLKLIYSGAFDADGREIGRGLSDSRDGYYLPLSTCARALPMNLRIRAPGKTFSVTEAIELP